MRLTDSRDIEITTQSRRSAERYDRAIDLLASYFTDPLAEIEAALAEDPDFVSGHCMRAALGVLGAERATEPIIRGSLEAGARLAPRATERERRHFAAARAWLEGDFHRAIDLYGSIVIDHPRDLLALQVAHVGDFYLGRQRMLRDRVAQVLPQWQGGTPGFGYVLGMLAFGLEETNTFEMAEAMGRRALALNRRDVWAIHAVAHVYEMTGQIDEGADWLEARTDDWSTNNAFSYHNFWHWALFQLERGDVRRVLELFDRNVWPKPSSVALEMLDAASLLFRLHLRGIDVGRRATSVADAWSDASYHGYYAFNDAHAAMAFVVDGRLADVRRVLHTLERRAAEDDSNAAMTRDVGLPFVRALLAFAEERHADVVSTLLPLRLSAHQFGGSNAQRDVIDQLLAEAALRSGQKMLVRALIGERRLLRPASPFAQALEVRLAENPDGAPHSTAA
ncbi:MAG TPA: tetratricopeptide repeat protein [Polyangiaceae bacterium]